jgi:hypothetical protein
MEDSLEKIKALAEKQLSSDDELRKSFRLLAARISGALGGIDTFCSSDHCTFEEYPYGEAAYGYLSYARGELSVAYRNTEEDYNDVFNEELGQKTYHVQTIDNCSITWLRVLSTPKVMRSFFDDVFAKLEAQATESQTGVDLLSAALNPPALGLQAALETAARAIDAQDVIESWKKAQIALSLEPADAITRASSLLESVCKHILERKNAVLPTDQSIRALLKFTLKALKRSPEGQTSQDLHQIISGLFSVVTGVGALRTHAGTAHGRGPGQAIPENVEASTSFH